MTQTINYQQINLMAPNPFTVRPIKTDQKVGDLILTDHNLRIKAKVAIEDVGLIETSTYISPMHLNPGWRWK
jgi:hypothetical protein